jgi:hypothetical protein
VKRCIADLELGADRLSPHTGAEQGDRQEAEHDAGDDQRTGRLPSLARGQGNRQRGQHEGELARRGQRERDSSDQGAVSPGAKQCTAEQERRGKRLWGELRVLMEGDRQQRRQEPPSDCGHAHPGEPPHAQGHEQACGEVGQCHARADRCEPVMDGQQANAGELHDGRLRGGEVSVGHQAMEELASAKRVNAVGVVPISVSLPERQQRELRHAHDQREHHDWMHGSTSPNICIRRDRHASAQRQLSRPRPTGISR